MQFNLTNHWYRSSLNFFTYCLLPFSWLFGCVTAVRRWLYRTSFFKTYHFPVPVIVVGNITVGGTGKTPFVIWLAKYLQTQGYQPGIVSRGVGSIAHQKPHQVALVDAVDQVGDEALLLKQTGFPVVICINRVAAVDQLLKNYSCNVVICDDGLQHYRLGRHINIVMVDAERGFGNQRLLPAGPLREKISTLNQHDFIILNGGENHLLNSMQYESTCLVSVNNSNVTFSIQDFPKKKVHAIAGIGHPEKFFKQLTHAGFDIIPHVFPDHHLYKNVEITFNDDLPVIMTEKDAVKCVNMVNTNYWYLKINVKMNDLLAQQIVSKLKEKVNDEKTN